MPVDRTMIRNATEATTSKKIAYETPNFERHDLRVITLGGTAGAADSGSPGIEEAPAGGRPDDKSMDEDWGNEV